MIIVDFVVSHAYVGSKIIRGETLEIRPRSRCVFGKNIVVFPVSPRFIYPACHQEMRSCLSFQGGGGQGRRVGGVEDTRRRDAMMKEMMTKLQEWQVRDE